MSSNDFHLHFADKTQTFDIDFQEQSVASSDTVCVNGRNYSLQGDTFKTTWLRQEISSLPNSKNTTLEDLQSRLIEIGLTDLFVTDKIETLSQARLSPSKALDVKSATEAYLSSTDDPQDSRVAIGILRPDGSTVNFRLGKNQAYGAHRIGSVTKTFTAFLALKLINDGKTISLGTRCGDLIEESVLQKIFAEPEKAKQMTLEQLLSHTSGLEYDDRPRGGPLGEDPRVKLPTLHDRFIYQGTLDDKYKHEHQPGDGTKLYSNIGFDIAAWMLEIAYNTEKGYATPKISFSQIMKDELFTTVFHLSEKTSISPGPSGKGDVIQAGCGDMVSSVKDLLEVAKALQEGEQALASHFGEGWHQKMLKPRDSDATYGLGCEANRFLIQFSGLNYEIFEDGTGRDVTAHIAFPLQKGQPGLVAMSDSNALGPEATQVKFRHELRKLAGLPLT